ncbi:hypothetical protein DYH09_08555, partial [bacterium CPR1]|nr:hypothetical protein [bacterium CPR1]
MAKFIYKVKDDQGRVKTGTLDVANKKEAEQQLKARGFVIQDLHPMPESKIGPGRQATGQAESPPRQPQNASMVIPPLSLPTRSNPPSGKIQSPAFLGRDPKADSGLNLPLESSKKNPSLTIQSREPEPPAPAELEPPARASSGPSWSPAAPPVPASPTLPPLSSSPGEAWPPAAPPPPSTQGWPPAGPTQQGWPSPSPPAHPPQQLPAAPSSPSSWPPAAPAEPG